MDPKHARLLFTDSEKDPDLFYLTRFPVGDPVLYFGVGGKNVLVLNDLERDRAANYAQVHEVIALSDVEKKIKEESGAIPPRGASRMGLVVKSIADERGIAGFEVPSNFPVALADVIRGHGFGLRWHPAPFVPERARKSSEEIGMIREVVRVTEEGIRAGIDRIRRAGIRDGNLRDDETGDPLTSEMVRLAISRAMLEHEAVCDSIIVAGGLQAVDPHDRGSGPLRADSPIIIDVFPRHLPTRYHGDLTRTVVRGKASDTVKRMHDAVFAAKRRAEELLEPGADGKDVHAAVSKVIEDAGFETAERDGRMVGFFHGTGHGLGLAVHESPGLGKASWEIEEGHVVTVEPGLYYPDHGGLRIEDDVVVTADGCENLGTGTLGYDLEI